MALEKSDTHPIGLSFLFLGAVGGIMGLLDGLYKENYKYINALEALDMLAKDEICGVSKIAEFLLAYKYHKCVETYEKGA